MKNKLTPNDDSWRVYLQFCMRTMAEDKNDTSPLNEDYYTTEEGYIVFTEAYHRKRGYCCQSGCRHCPYGYDKKTGRFKEK